MTGVIREAGTQVGMPEHQIQEMCDKLEQQFVSEQQLSQLDSSMWSQLGCPIGLQLAVAAQLQLRRPSRRCSSSGPFTQHSPSSTRRVAPDADSIPNGAVEQSTKEQLGCFRRLVRRFRVLRQLSSYQDWLFPLDHREEFKRGYIHAGEPEDLKAYIRNLCEMWMLTYSLLLGVIAALWPLVPTVYFSDSTRGLYVLAAFHVVTFTAASVCSITIFLFAVINIVSGTVHYSKYKKWLFVNLEAIQTTERLLVSSFYIYILMLNMLVHMLVRATLFDAAPKVATALHLVLGILTIVLTGILFFNVNFLGRVTLHAGLMCDKPWSQTRDDNREPVSTEVFEHGMIQKVLSRLEPNTELAISSYLDFDLETETYNRESTDQGNTVKTKAWKEKQYEH